MIKLADELLYGAKAGDVQGEDRQGLRDLLRLFASGSPRMGLPRQANLSLRTSALQLLHPAVLAFAFAGMQICRGIHTTAILGFLQGPPSLLIIIIILETTTAGGYYVKFLPSSSPTSFHTLPITPTSQGEVEERLLVPFSHRHLRPVLSS